MKRYFQCVVDQLFLWWSFESRYEKQFRKNGNRRARSEAEKWRDCDFHFFWFWWAFMSTLVCQLSEIQQIFCYFHNFECCNRFNILQLKVPFIRVVPSRLALQFVHVMLHVIKMKLTSAQWHVRSFYRSRQFPHLPMIDPKVFFLQSSLSRDQLHDKPH